MSHPLVQELIDILRQASETDMADAPAFVFMNKLRNNLVFCGLDSLEAETIATSMEVEIPDGAVTDEDLDTLSVLYCKIVMQARDAMVDAGFEHADFALKNIARQFTLKLT